MSQVIGPRIVVKTASANILDTHDVDDENNPELKGE